MAQSSFSRGLTPLWAPQQPEGESAPAPITRQGSSLQSGADEGQSQQWQQQPQPSQLSSAQAQPEPQQPQSMQQGQSHPQSGEVEGAGQLDSITLGQLKNLVSFQKPKVQQYDFPGNADTDTMRAEIDEFYSYVEAPQVAENRAAWEEWCSLPPHVRSAPAAGALSDAAGGGHNSAEAKSAEEQEQSAEDDGGALGLGLGLDTSDDPRANAEQSNQAREGKVVGEWTNLPAASRRKMIQSLLSTLEVRDPTVRLRASRALLYLLQGSFADTTSPEHQMHWMLENARMVRAAGGLNDIFTACKIASWKHDWLSSLPDHIPSSEPAPEGAAAPAPLLTPHIKLEYLEEINLELALHFAQLYILIEVNRGEEEWGDELMSVEPPLPIYLMSLVASLREKNAKGYPVKKLLLLVWKSILSCFGGHKDIDRCRKLARELEGLRPSEETKPAEPVTKATPLDFMHFESEITVKYPTFVPPARVNDDLPIEKIASAIAPIPPRKPMGGVGDGGEINGAPGAGMPGTPAPTPPPSPRPGKQKYQTDQTRPFVFPYSRSVQGPRMVPYSIEEAGRLYKENMHVSLEMWQMWRLREQCIQEESGIGPTLQDSQKVLHAGRSASTSSRQDSDGVGLSGPSRLARSEEARSTGTRSPSTTGPSASQTSIGETRFKLRGEPTMDRLQELEAELEAELSKVVEEHILGVMDNSQYLEAIALLKQQRADARRLMRIEMFYQAVLPNLQSSVIVLLKLLLATVTAQSSTNSPHAQAVAEGTAPEDAPPPTLEDIDIMRHREITSKAISAILFLCLKWFKASHAMKFHYLSQLLVDSNCLLLILKMFGLQEVANSVKAHNEAETFNFFSYCYYNAGREPRQQRPEDQLLSRPAAREGPNVTSPMGPFNTTSSDEIELLTDYSWRNFFSSLNFARILQKLTKRKVHRILLLVQYKSSAILKRTFKVNHPMLQRYVLKVIKGQVPFCGRKWRQSNMKVITAIYLNCRPDLRDEWLSGSDIDADIEASLPQEQALRALVKYYNTSRFGGPPVGGVGIAGQAHRRTLSSSVPQQEGAGMDQNGHPLTSPGIGAQPSFFESDILPPLRRGQDGGTGMMQRYIPDDVVEGYLDTYEDVLGEVFGDSFSEDSNGADGWSSGKWGLTQEGSTTAWARLGEILGESESISDSESIATIGDLGEEGQRSGDGVDSGGADGSGHGGGAPPHDENKNDWEHLSPKEMRFLASNTPTSPRVSASSSPVGDRASSGGALHRRTSSGGLGSPTAARRSNSDSTQLRPVLPFGPDLLNEEDSNALAIEDGEEDEEGDGGIPMPLPQPKAGGIDEVEHIFGD